MAHSMFTIKQQKFLNFLAQKHKVQPIIDNNSIQIQITVQGYLFVSTVRSVRFIQFIATRSFVLLNPNIENSTMNRRGLSIDNINRKYKGGSFIASPPHSNYLTTIASPVSMVGSPIGRRSVIRTPSPVMRVATPIQYARPAMNTLVAHSAITQPLIRRSVVRVASPVNVLPAPVTTTVVQPMRTTVVAQQQPMRTTVVAQQQPTSVYIQEPVQSTVVEKGGLIAIGKKVETVRETTIPTYEIREEETTNQRVGVNQYSGYQYRQPAVDSGCGCPWWLCLLLLLPLLGLLLFGLSKLFSGQQSAKKQQKQESRQTQIEHTNNTIVIDAGKCSPGFFFNDGNCMKCPAGSGWNTTHCVVKKVLTTTTSKTMQIDPVPAEGYGSSLKASTLGSSSSFFEGYSASSSSSSSSGSSGSSGSSASLTGSKTIGEEMQKLGLDYEGFRKKVEEGHAGSFSFSGQKCANSCQHAGDVVEPILEKKHHLRLTKH